MSITLRICILLSCFCTTLSHTQYLPKPKNINKKDQNGRKQGYWIYYGVDRPQAHYSDSSVVEEGFYIDDRKEGTWYKYDKEGILYLVGEYKNNRPFDPKISVVIRSSKVVEKSDCSYQHGNQAQPQPVETPFVPPRVYNSNGYYKYIAPKYNLLAYFPFIYVGQPTNTIITDYYTFVYPDSTSLAEVISHTIKEKTNKDDINSSNVSITFVPENRFWIPQPPNWGEDTMEYHSASPVILRNLSKDTLLAGENLMLNLKIQYFDGKNWLDAPGNPGSASLLPEMKGSIVFYPGEIIVTALPLFENEHRKLRIVFGQTISDEFYIINN